MFNIVKFGIVVVQWVLHTWEFEPHAVITYPGSIIETRSGIHCGAYGQDFCVPSIWQHGFKLRDYRKAESDICMQGDKVAKKTTHFIQHRKLQILVPHPFPKISKRYIYIYIYTYIYISPNYKLPSIAYGLPIDCP